MKLIEDIYHITSKFPKEEVYILTSQMRRASVFIASNIAEGCARKGNQEKIQFFTVARGSVSELDAQLEISMRLKYIDNDIYMKTEERLDRVSRMLQGLIQSRKNILASPNCTIA